jgi:hypothetical protein
MPTSWERRAAEARVTRDDVACRASKRGFMQAVMAKARAAREGE